MRGLYLVAALLVFSGARVAHASPLLELTGGFGGMGGLQARHTGVSAASAYFNPALLAGTRSSLSVGFLVLNTDVAVQIDPRSPENHVPNGLSDTFHANGVVVATKPIGTDLLQNGRAASPDGTPALAPRPQQLQGNGQQTLTYAQVGAVWSLFKQRLGIGVYGLVPIKNFLTMRTYFVDEREQYMTNSLQTEMYGDRLTALSFAFAAGVRLTDTLSIGLGTTLGLYAYAGAGVFVASAAQLNKLDVNIDVKAKVSLTPHLGVAWNPGKRWHLTATLHAPQKVDVVSGFKFLLASANEQSSGISYTLYYQPWQASGGLGYDFYVHGDQTWSVSGLAHYQRWSTYIDRQSVRPEGAYEWKDTLTGAVGVRTQNGPLSLGLDGQYKPTPVPLQTGRTNYVDNNRLGLSFSAEYAFEVLDADMKLGLQLQLYRMLARHVKKIAPPTADGVNHTPQLVWDEVPDDSVNGRTPVAGRDGLQTNNPGWPGYKSLGWVSSGGIYLTVFL